MFETKTDTVPNRNTVGDNKTISQFLEKRNINSERIAEYIKTKLGDKWEKISQAKAGDKRLDSILIHLFFSKNRLLETTSLKYGNLGSVNNKSKQIVDFIDKNNCPSELIDTLNFSVKGYATFTYKRVLEKLYDKKYRDDFKYKFETCYPVNRDKFYSSEESITESFEDHELEF